MNEKIEAFFKNWLSGTTCFYKKRTVFWVSDCRNFFILKHHGHSDYTNRVDKCSWCCTCYYLYDIRKPEPNLFGSPSLQHWEGRWKKEYEEDRDNLLKYYKL